jgi:hypothetical protein
MTDQHVSNATLIVTSVTDNETRLRSGPPSVLVEATGPHGVRALMPTTADIAPRVGDQVIVSMAWTAVCPACNNRRTVDLVDGGTEPCAYCDGA